MVIGIIGGGQLGMMMAESAKDYGFEFIGIDPNPKCPLSYVADEIIVADYNDKTALELLYKKCDIITYEFENVDLDLVDKYQDKIPQKSNALRKSRDRFVEKNYAKSLGIPTPKFCRFASEDSIAIPSIIKTTTGGYDGKGQHIIQSLKDIDQFMPNGKFEYIVEEFMRFDYEISVVCTRDSFGNIVTYPIPKNEHRNGILFISEVYNSIDDNVALKAIDYTKRFIEDLDYVGTLAVEFFVVGDNVVFNEFAPRPHNSGHYTIEGCSTSQFENHIRAISRMKVHEPKLVSNTAMINVLGQNMEYLERSSGERIYVHMYHKDQCKVDRKMGHITVLGNKEIDVKNSIKTIVRRNHE